MKQKNLGGRKLIFKNPEELQAKITEYLNNCPDTKTVYFKLKDFVEEKEVPRPTITGLALFLGFESRQSFYDYEDRKRFSYTIKRARTFIERTYEQMLADGNPGAIFALKNFGWTDKTEHELSSLDGKPLRVVFENAK